LPRAAVALRRSAAPAASHGAIQRLRRENMRAPHVHQVYVQANADENPPFTDTAQRVGARL